MSFTPLKAFFDLAAKIGGVSALVLAFMALISWMLLRYLVVINAPKPTRDTVDKVVVGLLRWAGILALIVVIFAFLEHIIPKPPESAVLLLNPKDREGPEWFHIEYSADGKPFEGKGAGISGLITVPADASGIELIKFEAPFYDYKLHHDGIAPPYHVPIENHVASLEVIYDAGIATFQQPTDLLNRIVAPFKKDDLVKPATIPDGYRLNVQNDTDHDVDLHFFNCRDLTPPTPPNCEDEETVTVETSGSVTIYPKWIGIERLRKGHDRSWNADKMRQFYEPSGWFIAVARYRRLNESKQREELLGLYNLFKSAQPQFTLERTNEDGKEFHVEIQD